MSPSRINICWETKRGQKEDESWRVSGRTQKNRKSGRGTCAGASWRPATTPWSPFQLIDPDLGEPVKSPGPDPADIVLSQAVFRIAGLYFALEDYLGCRQPRRGPRLDAEKLYPCMLLHVMGRTDQEIAERLGVSRSIITHRRKPLIQGFLEEIKGSDLDELAREGWSQSLPEEVEDELDLVLWDWVVSE